MKQISITIFISIFSISCMHSGKIKTNEHTQNEFKVNKVIAHRGAWKATGLPENSVAALKAAIEMRCFGSETDVHLTDDGAIVVNHDPDYHKMVIQSSNLSSLRKIKLSNGEKLPELSDFLKVITQQDNTKLIVEIKPSVRGREWAMKTVAKVVSEVNKYGAASHVIYISFDFEICREILRWVPGAKVQYLNGDKTPQEVSIAGLTGIDYHYTVFQKHPEYFQEAKDLGLKTNAWTVNDSLVMDWLLAKGVDFITTNEPAIALEREQKSPSGNGWKLTWSDEFFKEGLPDTTNWRYNTGGDGWGNNEKQFYTRADSGNAFVRDGMLYIVAKKEQKGKNGYTSARLVTSQKHSWKYGRIEARLKLPEGVGLWPAFWMLGDNINGAGWPKCGEIDIMEHVGYMPHTILGTIHTDAFNHVKGTQRGGEYKIDDPYNQFHVYAVEWNAEKLTFFVDDRQYMEFANEHKTVAEWPFDQPFFIILNLAVGGNLGGLKGIDDHSFPATYLIDYVRVWQK